MKKIQLMLPTSLNDVKSMTSLLIYRGLTKVSSLLANKVFGGIWVCPATGAALRFRSPDYHGEVYGKKMMISNFHHKQPPISPAELYRRIEQYFKQKGPSVQKGTCSFTNNKTDVVEIISTSGDPIAEQLGIDVRFGSNYWNGHYASLEAFRRVLVDNGSRTTVGTSVMRYANNAVVAHSGFGGVYVKSHTVAEIKQARYPKTMSFVFNIVQKWLNATRP